MKAKYRETDSKSAPNPPPPARTADWLSNVLHKRFSIYLRRLRQCRKRPSGKPVHDLRVATRRLVSPIQLLGSIFPGCKTQKALGTLKKQFRSLGELRDANILRADIEAGAGKFPELLILLKQLRHRERGLIKAAAHEIKRFEKRRIQRCVSRLLAELDKTSRNVRRQKRLNIISLRFAREAFAETQKRRRLIDYGDLATIHRVRIAFKKFRYIVECLPPELTGLDKRELRSLNRYQGKMGDIQDLVVIQSHIGDFLNSKAGSTANLDRFARHLRQRQALAIRRYRKSAEALRKF